MAVTPNMQLINPSPLVTVGPTWAENISDSLDLIDAHDHTSTKGVQIPTAGLNINADLDFNSWAASGLRAIILEDQVANPSDNGAVYIKNGNFFLKNTAGQVIQLTSGSSINVGAGSISGLVAPASASFSSITNTYTWLYDTSLPARQVMADISLYEYGNATAQPVTLASPSGVTAHTLKLPPAAATRGSLLSVSTAGQISNFSSSSGYTIPRMNSGGTDVEFSTVDTNSISNLAVTSGKLADNAVLIQKLFSRTMSVNTATEGNVGYANASGNFTSTSPQNVATVTLSTQGRPCMFVIDVQDGGAGTLGYIQVVSSGIMEFVVDGSVVSSMEVTAANSKYWSGISKLIQPVGGGSHTIELRAYVASGGHQISFNNCRICVYEL